MFVDYVIFTYLGDWESQEGNEKVYTSVVFSYV